MHRAGAYNDLFGGDVVFLTFLVVCMLALSVGGGEIAAQDRDTKTRPGDVVKDESGETRETEPYEIGLWRSYIFNSIALDGSS